VLEDVVDVGRSGRRVRLVETPIGVGRADEPVTAPRDDEEHALLGAQQQPELRLKAVARHDEVHALRGAHLELAALTDHRLGVVGPDAGRVDDLAGANVESLARLEVVGVHTDDALADLDEALDPHTRGDVGTIERGRAREVGDVAGVIDLRVVVGETADEGARVERGHGAQHLPLGEVAVVWNPGRATAGVAEEVVEQHARANVDALEDRLGQRVEKTHRLDQVRRDALQQQPPLDERLANEPKVELFKIADAAVHQLGRPARGAARPVPRLDHADAEAARDRVERAAGTDDAATDHENVERCGAQGGEGELALCGA
jgi:hypothetical protein